MKHSKQTGNKTTDPSRISHGNSLRRRALAAMLHESRDRTTDFTDTTDKDLFFDGINKIDMIFLANGRFPLTPTTQGVSPVYIYGMGTRAYNNTFGDAALPLRGNRTSLTRRGKSTT